MLRTQRGWGEGRRWEEEGSVYVADSAGVGSVYVADSARTNTKEGAGLSWSVHVADSAGMGGRKEM